MLILIFQFFSVYLTDFCKIAVIPMTIVYLSGVIATFIFRERAILITYWVNQALCVLFCLLSFASGVDYMDHLTNFLNASSIAIETILFSFMTVFILYALFWGFLGRLLNKLLLAFCPDCSAELTFNFQSKRRKAHFYCPTCRETFYVKGAKVLKASEGSGN